MVSPKKLVIPALAATSLLLAACGSSSYSSSSGSGTAAASASKYASHGESSSAGTVMIGTASSSAGTYLTAGSRKALYLWDGDSSGKSACSGACAEAWPPLTATEMPKVTGGASAADITLVSRSDGSKQVAYKSRPLYYYAGDTGPGMTNGQGSDQFGAKWWLVSASGTAIAGSSSGSGSSGGAYGAGAGGYG